MEISEKNLFEFYRVFAIDLEDREQEFSFINFMKYLSKNKVKMDTSTVPKEQDAFQYFFNRMSQIHDSEQPNYNDEPGHMRDWSSI